MEGAWGGVWLPIRSADWRSWAGSGAALGVAGVSRNAMPTPEWVLNTRKRKQLTAATFGYSFGYRTPTKKYFATKLRLPEVGYRPEYDSPENFRSSLLSLSPVTPLDAARMGYGVFKDRGEIPTSRNAKMARVGGPSQNQCIRGPPTTPVTYPEAPGTPKQPRASTLPH